MYITFETIGLFLKHPVLYTHDENKCWECYVIFLLVRAKCVRPAEETEVGHYFSYFSFFLSSPYLSFIISFCFLLLQMIFFHVHVFRILWRRIYDIFMSSFNSQFNLFVWSWPASLTFIYPIRPGLLVSWGPPNRKPTSMFLIQ